MQKISVLPFIIALLVSCTSKQEEVNCASIQGATFTTNNGKIESILQRKCGGSACHSKGGEAAVHWAIDVYDKVKIHGDHMAEEIEDGEMPPKGSAALTNDEKDVFACWASNGFPN